MIESAFWLADQYCVKKQSVAEIAQLAGCDVGVVTKVLSDFNLMRASGKALPLYMNEKWLRHVIDIEQRPLEDIASLCDCSPDTLIQWARKFGIRRAILMAIPRPTEEQIALWSTAEEIAAATHCPLDILLDWEKIDEDEVIADRAKDLWLMDLAEKGLAEADIAALANVNLDHIRKFLRKYAIPTVNSPGRAKARDNDWIMEQIRQGRSISQMAADSDSSTEFIEATWEIAAARVMGNGTDITEIHYSPLSRRKLITALKPKPLYDDPVWLAEQLRANRTCENIAEEFNAPPSRIYTRVKKFHLNHLLQKRDEIEADWLREQLDQNKTLDEMSAAAGVPKKRVKTALSRNGLLDRYRKQQRFYDDPNWLSERLRAYKTTQEIALEAKVGVQVIRSLLRKYHLVPQKKHTDPAWLLEQIEQNKTIDEICALSDASKIAVSAVMRKHNLMGVYQKQQRFYDDRDWLMERINDHRTPLDIALEANVSIQVVLRLLQKYNIPIPSSPKMRTVLQARENRIFVQIFVEADMTDEQVKEALKSQQLLPFFEKQMRFYDNARWLSARLKARHSVDHIAAEANISPQEVEKLILKHHLKGLLPPPNHLNPDWLKRQIEQKKTLAEISAIAGVEEKRLAQILTKKGLMALYREVQRFYDDRDWLAMRVNASRTVKEIAKEANVSEVVIRKFLKKHGLVISPPSTKAINADWLTQQIDQGKTSVEIATEGNISESEVLSELKKKHLIRRYRAKQKSLSHPTEKKTTGKTTRGRSQDPDPAAKDGLGTASPPVYDNAEWLSSRIMANCSIQNIATEAGVSAFVIRRLIKKYNLSIQPISKKHTDPNWLRAQIEQNKTIPEIGDAAKISGASIYASLKKHGLLGFYREKQSKQKPDFKDRGWLAEQLTLHPSVAAVAKATGISISTLHYYVRKYNLRELRPQKRKNQAETKQVKEGITEE